MTWFSDEMSKIAKLVQSNIKNIIPITEDARELEATMCDIWEKSLSQDNQSVVADHNHFTGQFRGYAQCNLAFKKLFVIPIVFHNL